MAAAFVPGPHDPQQLSARERAVLAWIEDDLTRADPDLARSMDRRIPSRPRAWLPVSIAQGASLVAVLVVLMVAATVLPASWWAALGLLTGLLVAPWIVLCAGTRTRAG